MIVIVLTKERNLVILKYLGTIRSMNMSFWLMENDKPSADQETIEWRSSSAAAYSSMSYSLNGKCSLLFPSTESSLLTRVWFGFLEHLMMHPMNDGFEVHHRLLHRRTAWMGSAPSCSQAQSRRDWRGCGSDFQHQHFQHPMNDVNPSSRRNISRHGEWYRITT